MAKKRSPTAAEAIEETEVDPPRAAKRSREENVITPPASPTVECPLHERNVNLAGKPPEAGVILQIYVENFMCHRKLTVELCRNVNFIHGQNGSGKSAILAAIQICLGAGARRTNRARNLKELVRKDAACSHARVRVTLLNRGADGYHHETYGDTITVERTIALRGGWNGYKLLDSNMKEQSRSKKDLDEMLDKLNIQVENPVAILDQEDSKKFLTGKAEDKYAFFMKATELERIDRSYATTLDKLAEMADQSNRMHRGLENELQQVNELKKEWEKHQEIQKLKDKLEQLFEVFGWSCYQDSKQQLDKEIEHMKKFEEKAKKNQLALSQAEEALTGPDDEQSAKKAKLEELIQEAQDQSDLKQELEVKRKSVNEPQRVRVRKLKQLRGDLSSTTKNLEQAKGRLEEKRREILAQAGSAESEEARRTERLKEAEGELEAAKQKQDDLKQAVTNALHAYEELEPHVEQAKQNCSAGRQKLKAVESKVAGLESSGGGSLAMFGQRCIKVRQMVDKFQQHRKFSGPVFGPIGAYVKVASGKEAFAALAEFALGIGVLDRFILTNDQDRKLMQRIRKDAGCIQDCGIYQCHQTRTRFQVPPPPVAGIETIASVLNIEDDMVFNCLVDNCGIEWRALSKSKKESEHLLLTGTKRDGHGIRGVIKEVFCLPDGDHWSVRHGNLSMIANEKKLRQSIGIDKSAALAEAKRELELLAAEVRELREEESKVEHEHTSHQKDWNTKKRALQSNHKAIERLISKIDDIKAEQDTAANFDTDTSEFEQDVADAEHQLEDLKDQESTLKEEIEQNAPEIQKIAAELEEVRIRNEKVLQDMKAAQEDLSQYARSVSQRQEKLEKKREKLRQYEEIIAQQQEKMRGIEEDVREKLLKVKTLAFNRRKKEQRRSEAGIDSPESPESECSPDMSQDATEEELEAIEIVEPRHEPAYYEARIQRAKQKIEDERKKAAARGNPVEAYQKYIRAQTKYNGKLEQIEKIEATCKELRVDMRDRKKRWRQFQKHISAMTDSKFDEILSLRGSSGTLDFNHKERNLGLVVQKDSADSNSQQKDVKALSGGERSFTTIALLLALGENLETPFRILDEFDVFLDPVSRKLAMDSLIAMAKDMGHRQFIFITPQDVSNITTDPMLKILKLNPPDRTGLAGMPSQQTLDFSSQRSN